jgi:hypothetical protein
MPEEEMFVMFDFNADVMITGLDGGLTFFHELASMPGEPLYRDIRDVLRVMSVYPSCYSSFNISYAGADTKSPTRNGSDGYNWALKTPLHSIYLPTLLKVFPEAQVVILHRDWKEVIPSLAKTFHNFTSIYQPYSPKAILGNNAFEMMKVFDHRMKTDRAAMSQSDQKDRIIDVNYTDLIHDSLAVVHRVYKHFGREVTPEFQARMEKYLKDNPQGKHGRHSYNLEEYALNADVIDRAFKD